MEAINNLRQVKENWHPHTLWEQRQNEDESCFDEFKNKPIFSNEEISYSKRQGKVITDAIKTMDQLSINKSENAMVTIKTALGLASNVFGAVGLLTGYLLSKFKKSPLKTPKMSAFIGYSIFTLIGISVSNFISAHFEKKATRIARFQARNKEMQDIRNFVVYNDEQIKQAKEIAKNMPEVKDITEDMTLKESLSPKNVFKKSFEAIKSLNRDYSSYKNWHKEYLQQEKQKQKEQENITLTKEEELQAQKDKNTLLRTIRKLEIGSNNYEINFNFAVRTAAILSSIASVAGGFLGFWAFGRLSQRASANKIISTASNVLSKLSIPAGIASLFLFVGPLTKLSKDSAKIGRQKETEKLFSHERNFIPFTDEQIQEIRQKRRFHRKPKTATEIVVNDVKEIANIKKDFEDYNKYKNSELKEDLKVRAALKTLPVSDKQMQDAKKLQRELFMAFEKIDDKTESFVDDTAAFSDVCAKVITGVACTVANIVTLKLFGNKISQFTKNKTMPGFFEGLKLTKHLSLKNIASIFILPFVITRGIIFLVSLASAETQKKACKIGMMSAIKDLNNSKNFAEKKQSPDDNSNKKSIFADFIKNKAS